MLALNKKPKSVALNSSARRSSYSLNMTEAWLYRMAFVNSVDAEMEIIFARVCYLQVLHIESQFFGFLSNWDHSANTTAPWLLVGQSPASEGVVGLRLELVGQGTETALCGVREANTHRIHLEDSTP